MYIVKKGRGKESVYVTVEPTLVMELFTDPNQYPVCFAWTYSKAEAVRFTTQWHANAVAEALPGEGTVLEVST